MSELMNTSPSSSSSMTSGVSSSEGTFQKNGISVSQVVTCGVCKEIYSTPTFLPCGHFFCLRCVKFLANESTSVVCPKCNVQSTLPAEGPEGLTVYADIDRLSKSLRRSRESPLKRDPAASSPEDSNDLTCYHVLSNDSKECPHCKKPFCRKCQFVHCEDLKSAFLSKGAHVKERLVETGSVLDQKLPQIEADVNKEASDKSAIKAAFSDLKSRFLSMLEQKEKEFIEASDKLFNKELDSVREIVQPQIVHTMATAIDTALREIMKKQSSRNLSLEEVKAVTEAMQVLDNQVAHMEEIKAKDFSQLHLAPPDLTAFSDTISRAFETISSDILKVEATPKLAPVVIFIEPIAAPVMENQTTAAMECELSNNETGPQIKAAAKSNSSDQRTVSSILHGYAREGNFAEMKKVFQKFSTQPSAIERLIEHRDRSDFGRTLLHQACAIGNVEMIRFLVEEMHAKLDTLDSNETKLLPIQVAAINGHLDAVDFLLLPDDVSNKPARMYNTSTLRVAIINGHLPLVKRILLRCPSLVTTRDQKDRTLLHYAAENGHTAIVIELMQTSGLSVEEVDEDGNTVLHTACRKGQLDLVSYLKSVRPDLLQTPNHNGETPADVAEQFNQTHLVTFLQSKRTRLGK